MLRKADVFVQNLAPGAAERAGFGADALLRDNPRLIVCEITGYGDSGPYAEMKAYDFLIQCETGLASITGGPESPGRVGVSVADIGCGMNAHAAILQALYRRERTGKGCRISVSLFDGLADWMAVPLIHREYTGREPKRLGLNHATIAPYGAYSGGRRGAIHHLDSDRAGMGEPLPRRAGSARHDFDDPRFRHQQPAGRATGLNSTPKWPTALSRFDADGMADGSAAGEHCFRPLQYGRRICAIIRSCAAATLRHRAARSAFPALRRSSTANPSRSGRFPPSASTARRSGASFPEDAMQAMG